MLASGKGVKKQNRVGMIGIQFPVGFESDFHVIQKLAAAKYKRIHRRSNGRKLRLNVSSGIHEKDEQTTFETHLAPVNRMSYRRRGNLLSSRFVKPLRDKDVVHLFRLQAPPRTTQSDLLRMQRFA